MFKSCGKAELVRSAHLPKSSEYVGASYEICRGQDSESEIGSLSGRDMSKQIKVEMKVAGIIMLKKPPFI